MKTGIAQPAFAAEARAGLSSILRSLLNHTIVLDSALIFTANFTYPFSEVEKLNEEVSVSQWKWKNPTRNFKRTNRWDFFDEINKSITLPQRKKHKAKSQQRKGQDRTKEQDFLDFSCTTLT